MERAVVIDELDARLIELLAVEPRVGVLEASRRLGVARGTVQARLDRLQARGVVTGYGPDIDPAALDHAVTAFVTLEIRQAGGHDPVAERLAAIPEVLQVHTITGAGDMLCRVVARTNSDLQRVIDAIVGVAGVVRASTVIAVRYMATCLAASCSQSATRVRQRGSVKPRCSMFAGPAGPGPRSPNSSRAGRLCARTSNRAEMAYAGAGSKPCTSLSSPAPAD